MPIFSSESTDRYITLKEAASISGYSSDYIGQLIRGGKITGKQIYSNPVWMTTEQELQRYLRANGHKGAGRSTEGRSVRAWIRSSVTRLRSELEVVKLYKGVLYATMALSVVFSLFLFYIFSVSFDAWLEDRLSGGVAASVLFDEEQ